MPMPSDAMSKNSAESIEAAFEADNDFATTLAKGMAVLECFSAQQFSLSNADLAAATGLKRPTVARLTYTLTQLGYLTPAERGRYQLGVRMLSLTHPLLASLAVRQIARPLMQELATDVRGTVSIGVLDGCNLIYVETARSGDTGPHLPDIGSTVSILRTALGRALVSMLPKADRAALEKRLAIEFLLSGKTCAPLWQKAFGRPGARLQRLAGRLGSADLRRRRSPLPRSQVGVFRDQLRRTGIPAARQRP